MERREFLQRLTLGLAAAWGWGRLPSPEFAQAAALAPRLALLADAHLLDGQARHPESQALARAVAEIRALKPPPDLVLFAGDLAHAGSTNALELGKEILSDLPAPLVLVMGEEDGIGKGYAVWSRLFGASRFSRGYGGFHLLGLDTALTPSPQGPVFRLGGEQRRWLSRELARLDPDRPLVILSHAPLEKIFRPWQQWTQDGPEVMRLLARFSQVYCFHGHVHQETVSYQLSGVSCEQIGITPMGTPPPPAGGGWGEGEFFTPPLTLPPQGRGKKGGTGYRKILRYGLPSTSWPLPSPLQGTPAAPRPGLGPRGCGWTLAALGNDSLQYQPQVWRA